MQPHIERLIAEKAELDGRITRLVAFFGGSTEALNASISAHAKKLMYEQAAVMQRYSAILGERLKDGGADVAGERQTKD